MIVGRERELRSIGELLEAARGGSAATLLIRGEAGIGKSALLEAAADLGHRDGFTVLRATGLESEAELAYAGLLELCRPILGLIDDLAETQQVALRSALALGPAAATERFGVAAATLGLLAECSERAPLLVLVDDAQWLDRASAEALWFAIRRLDSDQIATLVSVRAPRGGSLGGLLDDTRFSELCIDGIDRAAAGRVLFERSSHVAPHVIEALHTGAAGNPLALIEIARGLTDRQLAGSEPLADPLEVPARLHDVYARQIAALEEAPRRGLLLLAASGSDDHASFLRALSFLELEIEDLLPAEAHGLVRLEATRAVFRHPLVRAAAYHAAIPAERRAAHAALASAAGAGSARAAWHRAEAALGPDEATAAALEAVGDAALSRGGPLASGAAFARSAGLTPSPPDRARRLLRGAQGFWAAGAAEQATAMLADAAEHCDDPRLLGAIRHLEGHIKLHSASPTEAHELLLREGLAVSQLEPAEGAFMIGEAAEAAVYLGDFDKALATARIGRELAVADGGMAEFFIAAVMGCGLVGTGDLEEGRREIYRCLAIMEENEELRRADVRADCWIVPMWGWLDSWNEALVAAQRAERRAREQGAFGELVYVLPSLAGYEYLLGAWPESMAHIAEASRLAHESGQSVERILALHGLAEIEAACGRESTCREAVAEGQRLAASIGAMEEWPAFALGLLQLGQGRAADAVRTLTPAVRLTSGQAQQCAEMAVFDLVEAHVLAGDPVAAADVLDAVEHGYSGRDWELAGIERGRGMLASSDMYDEAFRASSARLERAGMRFEWARTELCWGERLRRDSRRKASRDHLRSALQTFEALGATPWAERARNELRASGETIRRDVHVRDELTARELQVALQASSGKTNREVGAALFLSPKTVDIHLTRVYRKLGIHSRTELTDALARVGPVRPTMV